MYAIAFFATVILFSASLYVGNKIAEAVRNHKSSTAESDFFISHNPREPKGSRGLFVLWNH